MDCTEDFVDGTTVTLTASPSSGSSFDGWEGGGCLGAGTCTVTVSRVRDITAIFTEIPPAPAPPAPTPPAPDPEPSNVFTTSTPSVKVSRRAIEISERATIPSAGLAGLRVRVKSSGLNRTRCEVWRELPGAGSYLLRCRLSETFRRQLRRSSLQVTLVTSFEPNGGMEATQSRPLTIKRRR
ncbi:MAG: hypothetical protein KGR19_11060 [Acidobacteria bacterium]|nr:hypothetical protein [Acidobacteriota bacterium]